MKRTFKKDLERNLKDPEFAAGFAGARAESNLELLRCGVIESLNITSLSSKITHSKVFKLWR